MLKELTCIICPNGCTLRVEAERTSDGGLRVLSVEGATCPKGTAYAHKELTAPERTIATSVPVRDGELPLASVRLTKPIPRERISDAMAEIKKCIVDAPVSAGTVIIHEILGYDADVVITKNVGREQPL
ncbi:MAG: DUF1667 domain-containing protein [Clostridiales bacterium]|nr:DUF1667 domain-containing protein [Clostridiales bacterium]